MNTHYLDLVYPYKVGIVGCGHLGQTIALSLILHGLEKKNLLISYKGNPLTFQKLEAQGIAGCISENPKLFHEADIVFITIKPQDILDLGNFEISSNALIVSCMAGVSIELLKTILSVNVYRMMLSGPDTILSGQGVAAIYPANNTLTLLVQSINVKTVHITAEDDLDIFTAGVCMPAALLEEEDAHESRKAIERIGGKYPLLSELYEWAIKVLPHFNKGIDREAYIAKMITKGGITDSIIKSLQRGDQLDEALETGIARTGEITQEIQQSIINRKSPKNRSG